VLPRLHGAFALAILFRQHPDLLVGARLGSPLVVGYGDGETYLGSDALALAPLTQRIAYLEEGDWVVITRDGAQIFDKDNTPVERPITISGVTGELVSKGNHRHYMLKEIYEQPIVVAQTLRAYLKRMEEQVTLPIPDFDLSRAIKRVTIVACGTSYLCRHGRQILVRAVRPPAGRDRCRLRVPLPRAGDGRRRADDRDQPVGRDRRHAGRAAPCPRRGADDRRGRQRADQRRWRARRCCCCPTHAGPEIGVASTKAFTCQLAVLAALAANLAKAKGKLSDAEEKALVKHLAEAPARSTPRSPMTNRDQAMSGVVAAARDVLYLGRGTDYPLALEGALKLKEISYIHAEGYAAGEMKHGPIALIDEAVPVIVIAPSGPLFEKTVSNMQEVQARGGKVILISDYDGIQAAGEGCVATITMPKVHPLIAPLVYAVPVQLLAYHVAVAKGTDVDQPRNLAKSVTVE
jgi:glucosamine--fructose-6-phosphate aminotransferase (isomerizing)